MKKTYIQPSVFTIVLQHSSHIMDVSSIGGNGGFNPTPQPGVGTGDSNPQVKGYDLIQDINIWDDEW